MAGQHWWNMCWDEPQKLIGSQQSIKVSSGTPVITASISQPPGLMYVTIKVPRRKRVWERMRRLAWGSGHLSRERTTNTHIWNIYANEMQSLRLSCYEWMTASRQGGGLQTANRWPTNLPPTNHSKTTEANNTSADMHGSTGHMLMPTFCSAFDCLMGLQTSWRVGVGRPWKGCDQHCVMVTSSMLLGELMSCSIGHLRCPNIWKSLPKIRMDQI